MNNTLRILLVISLGLFLGVSFIFPENSEEQVSAEGKQTVRINDTSFVVDVANTPDSRVQGLSGREELLENEGMLFVFDEEAPRSFWMKEMNFDIDIIWINAEKEVVDITRGATPGSFPETFSPDEPAQFVLEINSGVSDAEGISVGDEVIFEL